jgi:hypothetical protein
MQDERMKNADTVDELLTRALEKKPEVEVPAGFAARVAGQVPARPMVAVPTARYGLMAERIGMAALLVALVVLAMRSADHTVFGIALEWALCAELAGLAAWLTGVWKPIES